MPDYTKEAFVRKLDDGTWYATIAHMPGAWASGATREECLRELQEVAEEWAALPAVPVDVPAFDFDFEARRLGLKKARIDGKYDRA